MNRIPTPRPALVAMTASVLLTFIAPALADDSAPKHTQSQGITGKDYGRITVLEENDSIYGWEDRYYTQGFAFAYLTPQIGADSAFYKPFTAMSGGWAAPFSGGGQSVTRNYEIIFGQSIFTPNHIQQENPSHSDRPYAGWLYTGVGMMQDTDHERLDHLELLGGLVGPNAMGRNTQNDWHQFMGIGTAHGWDHQLHDEPGFMLTYERKWRFYQPLFDGQAVDAIPELGATVGNVMTYGQVGLTLRFGQSLKADYGQARIRPATSGTTYFNRDAMDSPFGYYFYVAAQGRAVGRNIFLDGNTFESSRSVDKKNWVGDMSGGVALFWSDAFRLDGSVTYRTKEFDGQDGNTMLAGFNMSFGL